MARLGPVIDALSLQDACHLYTGIPDHMCQDSPGSLLTWYTLERGYQSVGIDGGQRPNSWHMVPMVVLRLPTLKISVVDQPACILDA